MELGFVVEQQTGVLQLEALPADNTQRLALEIVRNHLDLLAGRDFARLKKLTDCDDEQLREAQFLIRSLNPRPGATERKRKNGVSARQNPMGGRLALLPGFHSGTILVANHVDRSIPAPVRFGRRSRQSADG